MTAKQNNYDELDVFVEEENEPEPTLEAGESESALDVDNGQAVPSQRKFKFKYIPVSYTHLTLPTTPYV